MKQIFSIFVLFLFTLAMMTTQALADDDTWPRNEETAVYKSSTGDREVSDIADVVVNRITPFEYALTMRECDAWIERWAGRQRECGELIKQWQDIRDKVEVEASKVKLKVPAGSF